MLSKKDLTADSNSFKPGGWKSNKQNRTRNGAFEKGSLFCDRGIQFSFGRTALVVLGVHTRADVWTIPERSYAFKGQSHH